MSDVLEWVRRAAASRSNVLVTGETGTGKEVVARCIHELGAEREEPFLAVNLAAVPEHMVESELFGHERGAFTGADRRREGPKKRTAKARPLAPRPVGTSEMIATGRERCQDRRLRPDEDLRACEP